MIRLLIFITCQCVCCQKVKGKLRYNHICCLFLTVGIDRHLLGLQLIAAAEGDNIFA